jgi:hypothetical protein
MRALYVGPLLLAFVLFALFAHAIWKQPKRMKARVGFVGSIICLALGAVAFIYASSDTEVRLLLFPLATVGTLLSYISAYRLYKYWDPKYWDPENAGFLGWTNH